MKDRLLKQHEDDPYDLVREIGITPDSSVSDVNNASLKSLGKTSTPKLKEMLEKLRLVKRRLFVDFFLYQIDGEIVSPELLDKEIEVLAGKVSSSQTQILSMPETLELHKIYPKIEAHYDHNSTSIDQHSLEREKDYWEIEVPNFDLERLEWPDKDWDDLIEFDA